MLSVEDTSKSQIQGLTARLNAKTTEVSNFKLENERLKVSVVFLADTKATHRR